MAKSTLIQDMIMQAPNRRSFMAKLGIASAALGVGVHAPNAFAQSAPAITDFDILNFALNLEYLEAEFYTAATTGQTISQAGLDITGTGTAGGTTGGQMVTFTNPRYLAIAKEIADDEQKHVKFLRTALGSQAVAKPAINLAALGVGFANETEFLVVARLLEDIGVTAYGGAAPLISDKTILGYAARILATEAEHVGNIRLLVAQAGAPTMALDKVDHVPPPSGSMYFSTDSNALTEVRTPGEVLYLAYGNVANASSGGFFPSGVNGTLKTSSSVAGSNGNLISASPNPIPVMGWATGKTTITWNAPNTSAVQVRLQGPGGPLFASGGSTGSQETGQWVFDGLVFYLQDATKSNPTDEASTLAKVVVKLMKS